MVKRRCVNSVSAEPFLIFLSQGGGFGEMWCFLE